MIIPIGTDNPLRNKPMVNYVLIILNCVIFLYTYQPHIIETADGQRHRISLRPEAQSFKLYPKPLFEPTPQPPQLHQYITYAFLHAGWMHILGNMLFLFIFGNNVNDKLGNLGYLLLYLGGGVFSGLGHALFNDMPVLGASGAVATVTGAYMVLFPKTNIHVLYVIFFIGSMHVPALYFIMFKLIIFDNLLEPRISGGGGIAYGAHLAGYAFGVGIPLIMLALHWLPHSHYDLWALIDRWRRRRGYQKLTRDGYDAFDSGTGNWKNARKKVNAKVTDIPEISPQQRQIMDLRVEISQAANASNLTEAAEKYLQLTEIDGQQVLPQQQQLDIANKLMQTEKYEAAATAYESFLSHYRTGYPFIEQIELMLGLIYSRYLNQKEPAKKHLAAALERLTNPGQKQMCETELEKL